MLLKTVVCTAFVGAQPADPMARYARALDDMRVAYAQVSADYAAALQAATIRRLQRFASRERAA